MAVCEPEMNSSLIKGAGRALAWFFLNYTVDGVNPVGWVNPVVGGDAGPKVDHIIGVGQVCRAGGGRCVEHLKFVKVGVAEELA